MCFEEDRWQVMTRHSVQMWRSRSKSKLIILREKTLNSHCSQWSKFVSKLNIVCWRGTHKWHRSTQATRSANIGKSCRRASLFEPLVAVNKFLDSHLEACRGKLDVPTMVFLNMLSNARGSSRRLVVTDTRTFYKLALEHHSIVQFAFDRLHENPSTIYIVKSFP